MEPKRILLADDQLLIRAGVRALIDTLPEYVIEAECSNGQEALDAISQHSPDVLLLDIAMPGLSGIEVARVIRKTDYQMPILILSSIDRQDTVREALATGANGYLLKDFVLDELKQALDSVISGAHYLSEKLRTSQHGAIVAEKGQELTPRQVQILRLVASGWTTKAIARELGISPKTVEFHRARLMARIGAHDVTGLTRFALQSGVIA